jgi:hypothetical protein
LALRNKWVLFLARIVINIIRKYFVGGLSGGTGYWQWRWSDAFERMAFNKERQPRKSKERK